VHLSDFVPGWRRDALELDELLTPSSSHEEDAWIAALFRMADALQP
jgi:hypothetical protein